MRKARSVPAVLFLISLPKPYSASVLAIKFPPRARWYLIFDVAEVFNGKTRPVPVALTA
jgi:hypothetical protein